jgi:hypothetical protein
MIENFGGNAMTFGAGQTIGIRPVAQNDFNFGIEFPRFNGIDDRLQIRAAAGDQNTDRKLTCHRSTLSAQAGAAQTLANFTDHKRLFADLTQ